MKTVGQFTLSADGALTGPADYMRERGDARVAKIMAGEDVVFKQRGGVVNLENGSRVVLLDYLGNVVGRGRVREDDVFRANANYIWVTWTSHGETRTETWPTNQVRAS